MKFGESWMLLFDLLTMVVIAPGDPFIHWIIPCFDHGSNMNHWHSWIKRRLSTEFRCSFWFWLILNTPFNFPAETLIPDHKVSINIRRKNVWHLLLTTLVHGSTWEHMGASTGNQGFSMLTPVLKGFLVGFWSNPWNLALHVQAAAEELDVQEREMQDTAADFLKW